MKYATKQILSNTKQEKNFVNAEIDTKIAEWIVYLENSYKKTPSAKIAPPC